MKRRFLSRRGATLIEGMVASAIFAIAITGTIPALLVASRQNTIAGRLTHAGAIASQVRSALQDRGRAWAVSTPGPLKAPCSTAAEVKEAAGDMANYPNACLIDLDAWEAGASAANKLIPGYAQQDRDLYRRVLVYIADTATPPTVDNAVVVVSFHDTAGRQRAERPVALYVAETMKVRVEL